MYIVRSELHLEPHVNRLSVAIGGPIPSKIHVKHLNDRSEITRLQYQAAPPGVSENHALNVMLCLTRPEFVVNSILPTACGQP